MKIKSYKLSKSDEDWKSDPNYFNVNNYNNMVPATMIFNIVFKVGFKVV